MWGLATSGTRVDLYVWCMILGMSLGSPSPTYLERSTLRGPPAARLLCELVCQSCCCGPSSSGCAVRAPSCFGLFCSVTSSWPYYLDPR